MRSIAHIGFVVAVMGVTTVARRRSQNRRTRSRCTRADPATGPLFVVYHALFAFSESNGV